MRILIAGPDYGMEMGWRLMRWQAKIRWQSEVYDHTFIITSPEMEYIYQDFAKPIKNIATIGLKPNMWRFDGADVDYIQPNKKYCCYNGNEKFLQYGVREPEKDFVIIHPRKKDDGREWSIEKWNEYISIMLEKGIDISVVGTKQDTHEIGNKTLRTGGSLYNCVGMPLEFVVQNMGVATMIVGPSSGPMHLASLCKCPQLVWTDKKIWNLGICTVGICKGTNRDRYETMWNPFKTSVRVCDNHGWNPPVKKIVKETLEYMEELNA